MKANPIGPVLEVRLRPSREREGAAPRPAAVWLGALQLLVLEVFSIRNGRRAGAVCTLWLMLLTSANAFPPAPYHKFFGMVRTELGEPLDISAAQVILETPAGLSSVKATVGPRTEPGINYTLEVPMDAGLAPDLYQANALQPFLPFKLKVRIGQVIYLPIEMKGDYARLGRPGESTHLDLTLGQDSDNDGLPDAWENTLISASHGKVTLADIKPDGDADGDGIRNLDEYLAGTYAYDPSDGFVLTMLSSDAGSSLFEFLAIRGRTYSMYASVDFHEWTQVQFRVLTGAPDASTAPVDSYAAADVRKLKVEVQNSEQAGGYRYFKVMVQ